MICTTKDCEKKVYSKKLQVCRGHYWAMRTTGKTEKRKWPAKTPEYSAWVNMRKRCYGAADNNKFSYKERNIQVCNFWRYSYSNFFKDLGERPSHKHSLDRIDNDGNYSCGQCKQCLENGWPANCRWASKIVQQRNRRSNVLVTCDNKTRSIAEWAQILEVPASTLYNRKRKGWADHLIIKGK